MQNDGNSGIEKDIGILEAVRHGRLNFNLRIVEASTDKSMPVLSSLRMEAMYQLAEFFFLLQGFGIETSGQLNDLLERHNNYISQILAEPEKMQRMGLTKDRLLASIFDGETKPRILKTWSDEPGTLDQSSIGRLLVAIMSEETARKVVVACGAAGFLMRKTSAFRLVHVKSTGVMEAVYGGCLREVRERIGGLQ